MLSSKTEPDMGLKGSVVLDFMVQQSIHMVQIGSTYEDMIFSYV